MSKTGAFAYYSFKVGKVLDAANQAYELGTTESYQQLVTEVGEMLGIGIPLWFLDMALTKTGLDRVFDSLRKRASYSEYSVSAMESEWITER